MDDPVVMISNMLRRIQDEGCQGNFVIFIANANMNYYIQIIGQKCDTTLFAEAVSNEFLDSKHLLDARHMKKLEELGWNIPGLTPNFHREWIAKDDQDRLEIAKGVMDTFLEVYGWKPSQGIELEFALE